MSWHLVVPIALGNGLGLLPERLSAYAFAGLVLCYFAVCITLGNSWVEGVAWGAYFGISMLGVVVVGWVIGAVFRQTYTSAS